jgi:hypothetical protein
VGPLFALPESLVVSRKPGWKTFGISHNPCHVSEETSKNAGIRRDDNIKMILKEEGYVSVDCIHVDK